MKLARFTVNGETEIRSGIVDNDAIHEFTGDAFISRTLTGKSYPVQDVRFKAPLEPRHIIGIGKNFVREGAEKPSAPDIPILFFKPLTSVSGPEDPIWLPTGTEEVLFESELAVVIGKAAKSIEPADAEEVIFGYTVANDVGASNYFHPEGHWTVGKAFDSFCPLGPVIETEFDYRTARIRGSVNGVLKQDAPTELMITPIHAMIAYISRFMTLMPGDVILTGTPAGAGMVRHGDIVDCFIEGIGHLINPIRADG